MLAFMIQEGDVNIVIQSNDVFKDLEILRTGLQLSGSGFPVFGLSASHHKVSCLITTHLCTCV